MKLNVWGVAPFALAAVSSIAAAQTTNAPTSAGLGKATTVVVTGKRPTVINKVDRKVYRTDGDLQATTGSVADVLGNIPSVEIDPDGNVSLRGNDTVTILVDGKPSSQMQGTARGPALQSLSAADIEQIEVITSPSAEFKPDGTGGIINIVTKKSRKKQASGLLLANLGTGGRYNANVSGSYNSGPFHLSSGIGVRHDSRPRSSDTDTTTLATSLGAGAGTSHAHQDQREDSNRSSGNTEVQYVPNDKATLGVSLDYSARSNRHSNEEHSFSSGASASSFDRNGRGSGSETNQEVALSYEQKMAREGEVLSFDLRAGQEAESGITDYTTLYSKPSASSALERRAGRQSEGVSEFTAAYVRPLASSSTVKLGYDVEYDQNAFDNTVAQAGSLSDPLVVNHAFDNQFRYRQTIHAAYATYDKKLGKLELLAGLRLEQVNVFTLQNISGDTSRQSYGTVYPTLNVSYALSDSDTLTGGFSKRVRRRDAEDLNPYINASDPNNLRQGNPQLKPELTNSLELGYRHDADGRSWQLTGYYRKSRNGDTELLKVISSDVVLITEANLPSSQSGGLEFIASGKLLPKLSYAVSGNAFYNQVNAQALGVGGTRSAMSLNIKGSMNYQPTTLDRWQVSINGNGKRLTSQGYVLPVTTVNLGYRHQLSEKIALVGTVSDLFNGQHQRRLYQTPAFSGIYQRRQSGQTAYVGLTYVFGVAKKSKDGDFSYDQ